MGVQLLYEISHISHTALLFTSAMVRLVKTGIKGIAELRKRCKYITVISSIYQKENTIFKTLKACTRNCDVNKKYLKKKLHTRLL